MSKASNSVLKQVLADQAKKFAKQGSADVFQDYSKGVKPHDAIDTTSPILNSIFGKGLPRGYVTEIFGEEGTGKTTICIQIAAKLLNENPDARVCWLDYEHGFDPTYAQHLGLPLQDTERLVFLQPDTFEQGADTVLQLMDHDLIDLFVVDSATAMLPASVVANEFGTSMSAGQQARLFSQWLPRLASKVDKGRKPALVLINQMRMKIDFKNPYKNGLDSAAANAIKFYAGVRLKLDNARGEDTSGRDKSAVIQVAFRGARVRATTTKSRVAPPHRQGRLVFVFGEGLDNVDSLLEMAEKHLGIKHGSYFKWTSPDGEDSFSIQGREKTLMHLRNSPLTTKTLESTLTKVITNTSSSMNSLTSSYTTTDNTTTTIEAISDDVFSD